MSALAPMTAEHWVRVIEYEGDMLYRCKCIITRVGGGLGAPHHSYIMGDAGAPVSTGGVLVSNGQTRVGGT